LARGIRRRAIDIERDEIGKIVTNNLDHAGIKIGIDFFARWMKLSDTESSHVPARSYIQRLYQLEVNPVDILVEAASLWLWSERNWGSRVKGDKHRDHLTGARIIRILPYKGTVYGKIYYEAGKHTRKNIGVLLNNLLKPAQKLEVKRNESLKAQSAALNI